MDNKEGTKWESLGSAEFEMGKLIGAKNNQIIMDLMEKGKKMGSVVVRSEKVARKNDVFTLNFSCSGVKGFGFCSSKKPFIE